MYLLKKVILDGCTKTAFSFSHIIYEPKDSVGMRTSLGSVMSNIIMTELESGVIKFLTSNDAIKFCFWYVDDIVLVV